uniref:Late embryogenesis abundant protein 1 n=1 Tax=Leymus chinensis TaxID=52714 RepID=A0A7U3UK23_LEYCH|nr:late embryogenesis abundant protein 1 [Leymus chinensis]
MQGGASAVGAAKEVGANLGASAWAGTEKTMAVVQETVEKAKAHDDPAAQASAEARKEERILEVEAAKQDAYRHNAAVAKDGRAAADEKEAVAADEEGGSA